VLCDIGGTVLERRGGGMTENIAIYCLKAASELNTEMCEECAKNVFLLATKLNILPTDPRPKFSRDVCWRRRN